MGKGSQGPHPHGGQEVHGQWCREMSPLLGHGFGPPALGLPRDKVGPGHQGHFSSRGISMVRSQISGAGAELASMVTTFCRWIQCRNICTVIIFVAYGAAGNTLTQQALVKHVARLTPGTEEVIWAMFLLLKSLFLSSEILISSPSLHCAFLSLPTFPLVFEELFVQKRVLLFLWNLLANCQLQSWFYMFNFIMFMRQCWQERHYKKHSFHGVVQTCFQLN